MSWCLETQNAQLKKLLRKAKDTSFGKHYNFSAIKSYEQYRDSVPVTQYADYKNLIERAKSGEIDTIWPGKIDKFAVSSGTTGKGKHIPITNDRLASDRRFIRRIVLHSFKNPRRFLTPLGYQLSLPGTIETEEYNDQIIQLGEISGFLGSISPWYLRFFQLVNPDKLVKMTWKEKFDLVLDQGIRKDVRVINAAPPWVLILFQKALEKTGKSSVAEVWPNLQGIFSGGVALSNYKAALDQLTTGLNIDYYESYGASEGYIGFDSSGTSNELDLVLDNNVFFEWLPADENGKVDFDNGKAVPTWEVEKGKRYGLIMTSDSGLWRYRINDLVEFVSLNPVRLRVVGRTTDILDNFGEAVTYNDAYQAIEQTCRDAGVDFSTFSMTDSFNDKFSRPHHLYFINWKKEPKYIQDFTSKLDQKLRQINRHYDIRRSSGAIDLPRVFSITNEQIKDWITSNPSINQTKMPEIIHDREKADRLLKIMGQTNEV